VSVTPTPLDTPVALLIFNRPRETRQVLAALRPVRPSRLLVVADGPRDGRPDDRTLCEEARATVSEMVDWPCRIDREYADRNLGCRRRVSSGLTWVFDQVPEAIVLEDDCVPHPTFFAFTRMMLDRYRDDERVRMVAGTNYLSDPTRADTYLFVRYFAVWGWATWARAWRTYDDEMRTWPAIRDERVLEQLYPDPALARFLSEMLEPAYRRELDSWAVPWTLSCLANNGLSVVPGVNLVTNIGFEGTRPGGRHVGMPASALELEHLRDPPAMLPDLDHERRLFAEGLDERTPEERRLTHRLRARMRASAHTAAARAAGIARRTGLR